MSGRKKVVIIDRGDEVTEYLSNFIPLLGNYEVVKSTHLIDALAKTNAFKPELLIYNLTRSQAHARDMFLAELQKRPIKTEILVICENAEEAKLAKQIGIKYLMIQPFDLCALSDLVEEILKPAQDDESQDEAKLLIADDEAEISDSLAEDFHDLGIKVYTARNGKQAFEIFKKEKINLAIIDLKMPLLSGSELIKVMEESGTPTPKDIILMTAALGDSIPELRRKNYGLMQKPLDMAALEKIILDDCEKFSLSYQSQAA